jgi:pyrroline-5-carboxylate reductase
VKEIYEHNEEHFMKISFIGGGNMAEAMLSAILNKSLSQPQDIIVSDIAESRRQHLNGKYGISVTEDNARAIDNADIVILAIKPQNLADVMSGIRGKLKPIQLVLSIIAGARIQTLRSGLDHNCIVRSMPNTPAQIGDGMAVWTTTTEVTEQQKKSAGDILGAMGKEIYVDDEKYLDMATAVSGSGPAYLFLFAEAMTEAAVKIGLPPESAQTMVQQTILGSAHLLEKTGKTPAELRRMVTSPGGTTAEAIALFEEGGFSGLVARAINAAFEKSKKLGG